MRKHLAVALAAIVAWSCVAPAARAQPVPGLSHQVLAFYYGWYTTAYGIGDWTKTTRWVPAAGPYISTDPATVARQVSDAKNYGINVFVSSWWPGRGTYTDAQMTPLLAAAAAGGIQVSTLIEDIQGSGTTRTQAQIVSDLEYVLSSYGSNRAYFKVNGRPVLFIYSRVLAYLPDIPSWNAVIARVTADYPGTILLCDVPFGYQQNPIAGANWAGQFTYSGTRATYEQSLPDIEARMLKADQAMMTTVPAGRIAVITANPGYDDTETTRPPPRPTVERFDGGTFRATMRAAVASNPDWIVICTYNEWDEGTQVEPSVQFGTAALVDNAALSADFLNQPLRAAMQ